MSSLAYPASIASSEVLPLNTAPSHVQALLVHHLSLPTIHAILRMVSLKYKVC
jgi:hypothetical protein